MRAHEFIVENRTIDEFSTEDGKAEMVDVIKFRDEGYDRIYGLYRMMMAVATTDGIIVPKVKSESWSGKYNTAHPYTEVERQMILKSLEAIGEQWEDVSKGDTKSHERAGINKQSPIQPFKGYPTK